MEAALFLIHTVFDLYIFIVCLRLVLQYMGVDFYNPFCQTIIKLTQMPINLVRPIFPVWTKIDTAVLFLLFILELIKFILLIWLQSGDVPNIFGLIVISVADIGDQIINVFFYALILVIILSWVHPNVRNPIVEVLLRLTMPALSLVRRVVPTIAGLDFSPIIVMVLLKLLEILLVKPISTIGFNMLG